MSMPLVLRPWRLRFVCWIALTTPVLLRMLCGKTFTHTLCLQADAELFDLGSHAAKAHAVALELYKQYEKRCMRIRAYQSLLLYLLFMVLYLTMLYMQRDAAEGHDVSSVLRHNLVPQQQAVQTWDDVYDYLAAQAAMYWRDPTCGNGICEAPFEFPSYARFGCAADCGFFAKAAHVHPTQVACSHSCCL
jgi:hypothetical protein